MRFTLVAMLGTVVLLGSCVDPGDERSQDVADSDPSPTPTTDASATPSPGSIPTLEPDIETAEAGDIPDYEIEGGNREIYAMDVDGDNQRRLTQSQSPNASPAWSPDGSAIAWVQIQSDGEREAGLYIADADGGNAERVAENAGARGIDWSPDGERIAFVTAHKTDSGRDEVHVIHLDTREVEQVTFWEEIPTEQQYMGSTAPAWSPDGERLAIIVNQLDAAEQLHVLNLTSEGPAVQVTTSPDQRKGNPSWSPTGKQIAYHGVPPGEMVPQIMLVNATGGESEQLTSGGEQGGMQPDWSPDGTRIAFTHASDAGLDIFTMAADGSDSRQLTNVVGNEDPAWSPDGERILFVSERDNQLAQPCSRHSEALMGPALSLEDLAWSSHQIVVGTIAEEHPAQWAEPLNPPMDTCLTIWTDYTVEVETQLRGKPAETVQLRLPGGTIGENQQSHEPSLEIEEGDRMLLFLREDTERELLPPAYSTSVQRAWTIANGTLDSSGVHSEYDGLDLSEAEKTVHDELASGEPDQPPQLFVPLDEAPVPE